MSDKPFEFNLQTANLSDLLDFRESMFNNLTEAAFKSFQVKLTEAVVFYLNLTTDHPIQWGTVDKFKGLAGFVVIAGFVLPIIGSEFKISETEIETVTQDNFQKFRHLVRFILPTKLLETGTRLELSNFIRDLTAVIGIASEQDLQQLLKEYNFGEMEALTSHPSYTKLLDKVIKPKEFDGFDISNLTPEQIKKFYLLNHTKSETKN